MGRNGSGKTILLNAPLTNSPTVRGAGTSPLLTLRGLVND
jgi:hypothetical protein